MNFMKKEDTRMQLLECGRYKKTTFARDIIGGKYHDDKFAEIFYLESVTYNSNDSGTKWQDIVLRDVTGWIRGRVWAENIIPEYPWWYSEAVHFPVGWSQRASGFFISFTSVCGL